MARCTLLVVDDHQVVRSMLADLGRCAAFDQVWTAPGGDGAMEIAQKHQPDVVMMDYRLKMENGCRVAEAVRDACPNALCIMVTAMGEEELQEAIADCGPDVQFFDKADVSVELMRSLRDDACRAREARKAQRSPAA